MFEYDACNEAKTIFKKMYKLGALKDPEVKKVYQNDIQRWRRRLPKDDDGNKKDGGTNTNRKKHYDHPISLDNVAEEFGFMPADPFSVEGYVVQKELYQALCKAIASLKKESRDIIKLLFVEGKSENDTALELGLTKSKVHYQKGKIIEKLKEALKDFF